MTAAKPKPRHRPTPKPADTIPVPSLRERLEAKARRRVTIPVQVAEDPAEVARFVEGARALLSTLRHTEPPDDKAISSAEVALTAAEEALAACWVHIPFQALLPADMEALLAEHATTGTDEDDRVILPHLAAECVLDPDLRDAAWWHDQITGVWSYGERTKFTADLFALNYSAASGNVPKG